MIVWCNYCRYRQRIRDPDGCFHRMRLTHYDGLMECARNGCPRFVVADGVTVP